MLDIKYIREHAEEIKKNCENRGVKVVFLAPSNPPEMRQYTRGLAEVGASVYGVGDTPVSELPGSLKQHLADYLRVPRILDEEDVVARVHEWLRGRAGQGGTAAALLLTRRLHHAA